MSDESPLITRDEFEKFWVEKIAYYRCIVCGENSQWEPLMHPVVTGCMGVIFEPINFTAKENGKLGQGYNFYKCICGNCGNTISFSNLIVDKWVAINLRRENPGGE